MHDINPRVQLLPDCRGEHIKLKLLASPSRWTYALLAFLAFSSKNRAFNSSSPTWIQGTQNFKETRGVSPRTQIKSIYSGEHIKRKLLMDPSKIIFTLSLKLIILAKKLGSKGGNRQQVQTRNTPLKFAFSALESRFAPIVEHIKRKPKTYASSSLFANMTYQNILRGEGHPGSDDAHPKTQPKQKESLCCVWVYIYICCVCEREKKICSISQEPSYSTENKI